MVNHKLATLVWLGEVEGLRICSYAANILLGNCRIDLTWFSQHWELPALSIYEQTS